MSTEEPAASQEGRTQVRQMLLIGAVVSAFGIALALWIDWFPDPASTQARTIDTLWDVLLIASVPIFVLVETIVVYSAMKFRMKPGEELKDGPPIHGNTKLEIIWTAIPAIILVGLCTYAYVALVDIEKAEANSMEVRVVGEQFTWTFFYRDGGKEIRSNQLYLPENTGVNFTVQSKDVIHDFWVPAFRMKIDAVPGIDTHLRVTTTDRRGEYPVVCAELCGLGHSTMRQSAHVMSQADFDKKLDELAAPPPAAGGGEEGGAAETDGKTLFTETSEPTCGSCHTLSDAGTTGTTGPDLDDVLADLSEEQIRQALEEPDADVAEGFQPGIMPRYGDTLSAEQIDALVEYLVEVKG